MSSKSDTSPRVDILLGPAIFLAILLIAALVYSVVVVQSLRPLLQGAEVLLAGLVVWLLYRLVVAVEDVAETIGRIEASLDDE